MCSRETTCFISSTGQGAPAMMPVRSDETSVVAKAGSSSTARNIVGTPYSDVQRSAWMAASVGPGANAIQAERCTSLYGVPTMFRAVLDDPAFATTDVSSLRTGIMAGAPCPVELMKQVVSRLHMPEVAIGYGM